MKTRKRLNFQRQLRRKRTRSRIFGTGQKPRLSVFRSNKFTYAQLIDDEQQKTIASAKSDKAEEVGKTIAQKAKDLNVSEAVFDRGSYKYHGRVKTVAESARSAGLKL